MTSSYSGSGIPAFTSLGSDLNFHYELKFFKDDVEISALLAGDYADSSITSSWDTDDNSYYDIEVYGHFHDYSSGTTYLETLSTEIDFDYYAGNVFDFSEADVVASSAYFNYGVYAEFSESDDNAVTFTGAVGDQIAGTSHIAEDSQFKLFTITDVLVDKTDDSSEFAGLSQSSTTNSSSSMGDGFDYVEYSGYMGGQKYVGSQTDVFETTLSTRTADNANIKSIYELTDDFDVDEMVSDDLTLVEAKSNFVDLGTTLFTQRNIGSDDKTSLLRSGDTVSAKAYWANIGSYSEYLSDVDVLSNSSSSQLTLSSEDLASNYAGGDSVIDGLDISNFEAGYMTLGGASASTSDSFELEFDVIVNASAGTVLSEFDFYSLDGENGQATTSSKVSANLVTYSGDVNYDGRVSLKDLAFLNAGVLAKTQNAEFGDVDANFDGDLDIKDLAVLSADFGKTLHSTTDDALTATNFSDVIVSQLTNSISSSDSTSITHSSLNGLTYENSSYDDAAEIYDDYGIGSGPSSIDYLVGAQLSTDANGYIWPEADAV